eukprot:2388565-Pyramimonas_sp.AAC.2
MLRKTTWFRSEEGDPGRGGLQGIGPAHGNHVEPGLIHGPGDNDEYYAYQPNDAWFGIKAGQIWLGPGDKGRPLIR